MENTAPPSLHPLRLGELLDQAIRIYRRNFLTLTGILALGYIPYTILQVGSSVLSIYSVAQMTEGPARYSSLGPFGSPAYWLSIAGSLFSLVIFIAFVYGLCVPVLVGATTQSYFGQKISILGAYRQFGPLWGTTLVAFIILIILVVATMIWFLVPIAGWFTGLGLLIFLGSVAGQLLVPVIVNEKLEGMNAISRAWDLGRRRFWWLIGFVVVFILFEQLVITGPSQLIIYGMMAVMSGAGSLVYAQSIATLVGALVTSLIQLLILPIQFIAWTVIYFDLRVRTEGFDLALATITPSENLMTDITNIPASPRAPRWLTWDEVGKFVVITLVGGGLYALLVGGLILIGVSAMSLIR